jgi:hypothetical protein
MIDRELQARIRSVLTQLQMLSDVDSASIVANDGGGQSKPDSSPPPGSRPDRDSTQPPPKDRSLYEWYAYHFARASDDERRRLLCYLAERDHAKAKGRSPQPRGKTGPEDERASMARIVEWYEGVQDLEVAVLEACSVQFVAKARRVHKRRPKDGTLPSVFISLDEPSRHATVATLALAGESKAAAARRLDVSRKTVDRYWQVESV